MSQFSRNVFAAFRLLQQNHRFIPATTFAGRRFASLVRAEDTDTFIYVFVQDGRPGGANMDVDLWVAPPEQPDSSLDRLGVGFRVMIASEYDVSDEFFEACQERIVRFLECAPVVASVVRKEVSKPSFPSKRWGVYQVEKVACQALLADLEVDEANAQCIHTAVVRAVRNGDQLDAASQAALPYAEEVLATKTSALNVRTFYKGRPEMLASALVSHLYANVIGRISLGQQP